MQAEIWVPLAGGGVYCWESQLAQAAFVDEGGASDSALLLWRAGGCPRQSSIIHSGSHGYTGELAHAQTLATDSRHLPPRLPNRARF